MENIAENLNDDSEMISDIEESKLYLIALFDHIKELNIKLKKLKEEKSKKLRDYENYFKDKIRYIVKSDFNLDVSTITQFVLNEDVDVFELKNNVERIKRFRLVLEEYDERINDVENEYEKEVKKEKMLISRFEDLIKKFLDL